MKPISLADLVPLTPYLFEIPRSFRADMRVPARIYATREMLEQILDELALAQIVNVATLPGITDYALALPDIHQGYGFPIGGVAKIRASDGVISPGGVGYDINCGVRLLTSSYIHAELKDRLLPLVNQIQRDVPSGVGRGGKLELDEKNLEAVLNTGLQWALKNGYAKSLDAEYSEENGCYTVADAGKVSPHARNRGRDQLGTLGSGNHFLELQRVEKIYDAKTAETFGLFENQITLLIHTGSRGLGHQVCTDYVRLFDQVVEDKYGIHLPDRELACAPFHSPEGQNYFHAMAAAANFAWVNRQLITHLVRGSWQQVLGKSKRNLLTVVYDVAHNIAKLETHDSTEFIVHRKGATRAFPPRHPSIPRKYQETGQPVLIPGSMGTASYVLAGTEQALTDSFGSACHGAGRRMSRTRAKKELDYNRLKKELEIEKGLILRAGSAREILEEAPQAYKDIDAVVDVVVSAGLARRVARLVPLAIIKG